MYGTSVRYSGSAVCIACQYIESHIVKFEASTLVCQVHAKAILLLSALTRPPKKQAFKVYYSTSWTLGSIIPLFFLKLKKSPFNTRKLFLFIN